MRHIRDPITGYCIICEKNNIKHFVAPNELDDGTSSTHGSTTDRSSRTSRPRWNDPPGKKTIYVNAYPNRSPSPSKKRRSSSASSSSSSSSDNDSARKSTALSSRSTSKLVLVERGSPTPTPRQRSPSPVKGRQKSPDVERGGSRCCGRRCCTKKTANTSRGFDDIGRYEDRCCGYRNFETASFGAGTWGIRRWCAPLIALLALMALAGLAVGIYFGVKAEKDKEIARQQVISYIKNTNAKYIIIGLDQPCNSFNNFTRPVAPSTTPRPNCNATTTRIVVATPRVLLPTDPDWLLAYTQASGASGRNLVLSLTSLWDGGMLASWVVGGVVWTALTSFGSGLCE